VNLHGPQGTDEITTLAAITTLDDKSDLRFVELDGILRTNTHTGAATIADIFAEDDQRKPPRKGQKSRHNVSKGPFDVKGNFVPGCHWKKDSGENLP
jgi:hypothetical protein